MLKKEDANELKRISVILNKIHLVNGLNTYAGDVDAIANGSTWSGSTRRKVSMPDIIEDHESNIEKVELMKKAYEISSVAVAEASVILNKYEKCKKCKGEQGSWENQRTPNQIWNDCEECDGHGYILIQYSMKNLKQR